MAFSGSGFFTVVVDVDFVIPSFGNAPGPNMDTPPTGGFFFFSASAGGVSTGAKGSSVDSDVVAPETLTFSFSTGFVVCNSK